VFLDLDGTLWESGVVVPGAAEAVSTLRRAPLPIRLVTNLTREPRATIVARLRGLGVAVDVDEVFSATIAAVAWLRAQGIRRIACYVPPEAEAEFAPFERCDERPDAVVIGDLGEGWTFARLQRAFEQLRVGARLVAIQKNRCWKGPDGWTLDAGPFVAALEYATDLRATLVGKPSGPFFEAAARSMGLETRDVVMVGDDVDLDVRGAREAGARAVLVRTGKFREETLEAAAVRPDLVLDSVAQLPAVLGVPRS